jgi:hypothetical protein
MGEIDGTHALDWTMTMIQLVRHIIERIRQRLHGRRFDIDRLVNRRGETLQDTEEEGRRESRDGGSIQPLCVCHVLTSVTASGAKWSGG